MKRVDGSWFSCDGAKAMSELFSDVQLMGSRGVAFEKDFAHPLQVHAKKIEAMSCEDCFVSVAYLSNIEVVVGAETVRVQYIGTEGLVLTRAGVGGMRVFVRVP